MKINLINKRITSFFVFMILIFSLLPNLTAALDVIHEIDNMNLTNNNYDSVQPATVMDSSGYIHVVFRANKTIHYMKINQDGNTLVRERDIYGNYTYGEFPRVAIDNWDNIHIVWCAEPSGVDVGYVFYAKLNNNGGTMVGPKIISQPESINPDIDIDEGGYVHVVWWCSTDDNVYYELMDNNGNTLGNDVQVSTSGQGRFPSVAGSGSRETSIVWEDQRNGTREIYYSRFYDGYNAFDEKRLTYTSYPLAACYPAIEADPSDNDNLLVVWREMVGSGFNLMYRKIDYYGTTIINDKKLLSCTERVVSYFFSPFTVDKNGDLHVVGVSQANPPSIYYGRVDNSGNNLLSNPELISTESTTDRYVLSVTATPLGEKTFIFWSREYAGQTYMERIRFTQYGSVSGHVYDEGGNPLGGAKVRAIDPQSLTTVGEGMSGADGSYVIPNLPPGTYHINAENFGYKSSTQLNVVVIEGQDTPNIDFSLVYITDPGSVSGTVYKEGGESLGGAEIRVYEAGTYNLCGSAVCSPSGEYQVSGLSTGFFDIVASKYGYSDATRNSVPVVGGQNTPDIDFVLSVNPGSLSGKVTEIDGRTPIIGAEVKIEETGEVVYTDLSGEYFFSNLVFGNYTLYVRKDGYRSGTRTTLVQPGSVAIVNFMLDRKIPPPENLETRIDESNNLILSWDTVTKDINGSPITVDYYSVYKSKISGGPYTLLGTTPATSFTDSDLIVGVRYYYVVTAHCVDWNLDSFYSKQISRIIGGTNLPPVAINKANPTSGYVPLIVQFDASDSWDPEGDNLEYLWDFDAKDGVNIENPDSREEKPSHEYGEKGCYTVTLVVSDSKESKDIVTMEIIVCESPSIPYPSVSVDILQGTYYPGDNVEIVVSGNTGIDDYYLLEIVEYVENRDSSEKYEEYRDRYCMGPSSFLYRIVLPALPVYNNSIHTVEAYLYKCRFSPWPVGDRTVVDSDSEDYSVEHNDADMIILTNPEALRQEFNTNDWCHDNNKDDNSNTLYDSDDILFLIQNAIEDDGILLYTRESLPSAIYAELRTAIQKLKRHEDINIGYLFILGGKNVIPFCESDTTRDSSYWDIEPDTIPDLSYSRLPTISKLDYPPNCNEACFLNHEAYKKALNTKKKSINHALVLQGTDRFDQHFSNQLDDLREKMEDIFTNVAEYALNMAWEIYGEPINIIDSYDKDTLVQSDFILIMGHGDTGCVVFYSVLQEEGGWILEILNSIGRWIRGVFGYNYNGSPLTITLDSGKAIYFLDTDDLSVVKGNLPPTEDSLKHFIIVGDDLNSMELNNPIIFALACQTSNTNKDPKALSMAFMFNGALTYCGMGKMVNKDAAVHLTNSYLDNLQISGIKLGDLYKIAIIDAMNERISNNFEYSIKELLFAIQYGYPKLQIMNQERSLFSKTKNFAESVPNTINFSINNHSIDLKNNNRYCISFTGIYNGESAESEDWILQGNPIVPYFHKIYDIPYGKTVDSISFTTDKQSLGTYELIEMPGTYFGELYEYYPLSYGIYMPEPVQWRISERPNGDMTLILDLFPFEYHVDTHEVIMHNNFNITITQTDRTASIDDIYMDKDLYIQGETINLVVGSIGTSKVRVRIDNENETIQNSQRYNIFPIETSNLTPGYHIISIQLFVGEALMDEATTGFTLTDALVEIEDPIAPEAVRQGDILSIVIPLINRDTSPTTVDLQLTLLQEDSVEFVDLGPISLDGYELKLYTARINTHSLQLGELALRVEGKSEFGIFRSNYAETYIVENATEGEGGTKASTTISALALSRIRDAESLQEKVNQLLDEAKEKGLDTSNCESIIKEAIHLLEEANNFYNGGNYIAANYYALGAFDKFKEALKCLEELLGK